MPLRGDKIFFGRFVFPLPDSGRGSPEWSEGQGRGQNGKRKNKCPKI
jgi:hypothetical protein